MATSTKEIYLKIALEPRSFDCASSISGGDYHERNSCNVELSNWIKITMAFRACASISFAKWWMHKFSWKFSEIYVATCASHIQRQVHFNQSSISDVSCIYALKIDSEIDYFVSFVNENLLIFQQFLMILRLISAYFRVNKRKKMLKKDSLSTRSVR